jgi:hypothetical protein
MTFGEDLFKNPPQLIQKNDCSFCAFEDECLCHEVRLIQARKIALAVRDIDKMFDDFSQLVGTLGQKLRAIQCDLLETPQ